MDHYPSFRFAPPRPAYRPPSSTFIAFLATVDFAGAFFIASVLRRFFL